MKPLHDRIFVRITKESRENIYSKEIIRHDGTKVRLWKAMQATDDMDERQSFLTVQTGIVEAVSDKISWIRKGDLALLNYDVCNSPGRFLKKDGEDSIYFLEATTTYHQKDEIAYQSRRTKRDQIVHIKGELCELSPLLGILRGDELIANDPYIFFEQLSNIVSRVSPRGILYSEKQKILTRKVIAVGRLSTQKYGIKKGDTVMLDDFDSFSVKLDDDHGVDCINDEDILAIVAEK